MIGLVALVELVGLVALVELVELVALADKTGFEFGFVGYR